MIRYEVDQGTAEWGILRIGRPTSSDFNKVMTSTGKPSDSVKTYENKLIAEIMLERPVRTIEPTSYMDRGSHMEFEARDAYQFINNDVKIEKAGFITDDLGRYGASPDAYKPDDNAGVEIKCPADHTHVDYLLDKEKLKKKYMQQVQGQIFVCGFDYVDLFSYHPELPSVQVRIEPNKVHLNRLHNALREMRIRMNTKLEFLISNGHLVIENYEIKLKETQDKLKQAQEEIIYDV